MPRSLFTPHHVALPCIAQRRRTCLGVAHHVARSLGGGLGRALACAALASAGGGCVQEVEPAGAAAAGLAEAAPQAAPAGAADAAASPAAGAVPGRDPPPAALTAEEAALLAADPATLTPEQRRARAYALRKKVMADPNSPARALLLDAQERAQRGELPELPPGFGQGEREPVGGRGLTLQLPGTPPPGEGTPPLGASAGEATP